MAASLLSVPWTYMQRKHFLGRQLPVACSLSCRNSLFTSYAPISRSFVQQEVPKSPFGVQLLHPHLHNQLFNRQFAPQTVPNNVDVASQHLKDHALNVENSDPLPNASFNLPPLVGNTIQEHFWNLGKDQTASYFDTATKLAKENLPPKPTKWHRSPGWIRYDTIMGQTSKVPYPLEESILFDTKVMFNVTQYPVMATAVSANAWYGWVSPDLVSLNSTFPSKALIPLGPTALGNEDSGARLIVGHHVGYDRARVADEYSMDAPERAYLDTLSLHVAGAGICSSQRSAWITHDKGGFVNEEDRLFCEEGSMNSLRDLARFYLNEKQSKVSRDMFFTMSIGDINANFEKQMNYSAADVQTTARIYTKVLRIYFQKCPHPVSFAGIIHMGQGFLPVNRSWKRYIHNAEAIYQDVLQKLVEKLNSLAVGALSLKKEEWSQDPWLRHLDWSTPSFGMPTNVYGKKTPSIPFNKNPRILPVWYKRLLRDINDEKKLEVGFKCRAVPYLLRLKWHGFPLYFSREEGWCFRVGPNEPSEKIPPNAVPIEFACDIGEEIELTDKGFGYEKPLIWYETTASEAKKRPIDDYAAKDIAENKARYFRVPHKDGEKYRCGDPLAANYITAFKDKILTSEFDFALDILKAKASLAYWTSARDRIRNQFVVWQKDKNDVNSCDVHESSFEVGKNHRDGENPYLTERQEDEKKLGIILPQMITMGTVTRRAVEQTWLTASNANESRLGSELKAMVCSPPGYKIVGADVDSEELWICGILGDAQFKAHGSTALGWMTIQGTKAAGTDMHSMTAKIIGIDRSNAKVFNYARLYGAGIEYAASLLAQCNPTIEKQEANLKVKKLYEQTKGSRMERIWCGGSESYTFNSIDYIATHNSRTPALDCEITGALSPHVTRRFITSRHNWVIQSSGVDYLHLLLVGFNHITRRHNIKAKFMLSLHDEVRYLVAEKDADRAALALQIANLWTRALFSARFGINNLPESVAFFSSVEIDHVMRKEVNNPCRTPSQPHPIPNGVSLDIFETLKRTKNGDLGPQVRPDPPRNTDIPVTLSGISDAVIQPSPQFLNAERNQSIKDI